MPKRSREYREGLLEDLKDSGAARLYIEAALEESDEVFLQSVHDVAEANPREDRPKERA